MRTFTDTAGREYILRITIPKLRIIRDELDIDLGKKEQFIALSNNPIDLVNVLYLLVRKQATEYDLSDVQFGEELDGDTLFAAWEAFCEAYLVFCPRHQAELLRKLMATAREAELMSVIEVEERLNGLMESYKSGSTAVPS